MPGSRERLEFNRRRLRGFTGNQLKLIAFVMMLCDHIGYVLIENVVLYGNNPIYWNMALATAEGRRWYLLARVLRSIGRLSFPIFVFMIMEGVTHTRNLRKYISRIFIFAFLSEVPFDLAIRGTPYDPQYQNVMFTLAFAAMSVALIQKLRNRPVILRLLAAAVIAALAYWLKTDYGPVGVMLASCMFILREDRNVMLTVGAVISAAESIDYACLSALAFVLIYFYNGRRGSAPLKYFFYFAYPVSLLVMWGLTVYGTL